MTSTGCLKVQNRLMYRRRLMPNSRRCEELERLLDQANSTYWSALHRQEWLSIDDPGRQHAEDTLRLAKAEVDRLPKIYDDHRAEHGFEILGNPSTE